MLNLNDGTYHPFIKPNSSTKYVSADSSHPPRVLKNLSSGISKRLSMVSSNKQMFDSEAPYYQEALRNAGFKEDLMYWEESEPRAPEERKSRKKNRGRKVLWFNPPWSSNVKTKVGRIFLSLLDKHFPPGSPLHKLFNRNNVKIGYSCCPSMKRYIAAHNARILKNLTPVPPNRTCNCDSVSSCPLQGQCMIPSIVYKGVARSRDGAKEYIGQTMRTFKKRLSGHKHSFKNPNRKNETTLSTYVWSLKEKGLDYTVDYTLIRPAEQYRRGDKACQLCLMEKTFIATNNHQDSLNKRSEILNPCLHKLPHRLDNYHGPPLHPPD